MIGLRRGVKLVSGNPSADPINVFAAGKQIDANRDLRVDCGVHGSLDTKRFRVVGVLVADADDYHLYITNLSREEFLPADLATIYRCRWEVELLLRELKTQYELDEFNTTKQHIVEILLYAALLSLVVSRDLLGLVIEYADNGIVFPPERWAATFRSHAQLILRELSEYLAYSAATASATDQRRAKDSQTTTNPPRTARYHHPTDC
jgi:putative transposase